MITIPKQLQNKDYKLILIAKNNKIPVDLEWQKLNNYYFDSEKVIKHLKNGGNYGVVCGNGLIVMDADTPEFDKLIKDNLPETYTVKTSKGYHYYFHTVGFDKKKVLKDNGKHLGEIQSTGTFVVGANCIHPSGDVYQVINDIDILKIHSDKINDLFKKFYSSERINKEVITKGSGKGLRNDSLFRLACSFREKDLTPEECLTVLNSINEKNNPPLSTFEVEQVVESAYGYKKQSITTPVKNLNKVEIIHPGLYGKNGKLISTFAEEIADVIKEKKEIFYRPQSKDIVEINIKKDEEDGNYMGFNLINPSRFITLIEKNINPVIPVRIKNDDGSSSVVYKHKSITSEIARSVINASQMHDNLYKIERIFTVPQPIIYKGELTFPKQGYDERFKSWLPFDAPIIDNPDMDLEKAKGILKDIYKEFCFQSPQDYTNAIAGLLTPFLRGLYSHFNTRSPVFFYIANRERAGKDFCAGITGIVYEGYSLEEPPISNSENKGSNSTEELRKKLLSAFSSGRKRLHFANNKGYINNAVFEGVTTSEKFSDRLLGRNEILTFDNEIEFSLSGNMGVGYTPDFANRCKFINLFLDIEDANSRIFTRPDLHRWVKRNRNLILSALYSLVKHWIDNGKVKGKTPFSSFSEWADICGGILMNAALGDPCAMDKEALAIGGDNKTKDMKLLFELCYEKYPEKKISKIEVKDIIEKNEEGLFAYLDLGMSRSDQSKFGKMFEKYVGRILSDIRLNKVGESNRPSRQSYMFVKEHKEEGNVGNVGNLRYPQQYIEKNFEYIRSRSQDANITKVTKKETQHIVTNVTKPQHIDIKEKLIKFLNKGVVNVQDFIYMMNVSGKDTKGVEEMIESGLKKGEWFEPRSGFLQRI